MRLSSLFVLAPLAAVLVAACSSSSDDADPAGTTPPAITPPAPTDPVTPPGTTEPTDIVFGAGAKFGARDCGVTLWWAGAAGDVKVGGEMNAWQPEPTKSVGGAHELRVEPSAAVKAGGLIDNVDGMVTDLRAGKGTAGALLVREELYADLRELIRDLKRNPWKFFWKE